MGVIRRLAGERHERIARLARTEVLPQHCGKVPHTRRAQECTRRVGGIALALHIHQAVPDAQLARVLHSRRRKLGTRRAEIAAAVAQMPRVRRAEASGPVLLAQDRPLKVKVDQRRDRAVT